MPIGNALAVIRSPYCRYISYKVTTFAGGTNNVGTLDGLCDSGLQPTIVTAMPFTNVLKQNTIIVGTIYGQVQVRLTNFSTSVVRWDVVENPVAIARAGNVFTLFCYTNAMDLYNTTGRFIERLGTLKSGDADGGGGTLGAKFNNIRGAVFDSNNNAFVLDSGNNKIKKINFTTLKSSTFATDPDFGKGQAITIDNKDNIYVLYLYAIKKIAPDGTISLFCGPATKVSGYINGSNTVSRFDTPVSITCDSNNNLYVVDRGTSISRPSIRKITPDGTVSTFIGNVGNQSRDGVGDYALFVEQTRGILYNPDTNKLYVTGDNLLRSISMDGVVRTIAGKSFATADIKNTYVFAEFLSLKGMAVDSKNVLYICDENCIRKTFSDTRNVFVNTFVGQNPKSGGANGNGFFAEFNSPEFLAFDSDDNLYVSDTKNHAIRKVTPSGDVTTFAGLVGSSGYADGNGINARFNEPLGIACDINNNVYVSDSKNHCIRKITPVGEVTTFAGTNVSGFADGINTTARFNTPKGLTCDNNNIIYVADSENSAIRSIESNGNVSSLEQDTVNKSIKKPIDIKYNPKNLKFYITYDGLASVVSDKSYQTIGSGDGATDGTHITAKFKTPYSLAIDNTGSVYVTDPANNNIRKITPA